MNCSVCFKKVLHTAFFILLFVFVFSPHAYAAERINSFNVTLAIQQDASALVEEYIVYDFGTAQRHGIYRDIPIQYSKDGARYRLYLSDISVTNENGALYTFEVSLAGHNKRIKVGRADVLLEGAHTYVIRYTVRRAISYLEDSDELYWNATGNEWPVAIGAASAVVTLPESVERKQLRVSCFAGAYGSGNKCATVILRGTIGGRANTIQFTHGALKQGEGLTVAVRFPKGVVREPSWEEAYFLWLRDNWIVSFPAVTFIILFYLWFTRGRDPKGKGVVVPQYEPPEGLLPAQAGTVIDERVGNYEISAEIIQLAVLGYLKITRLQEKKFFIFPSTDYVLEKLEDAGSLASRYQRDLLHYLFLKNGRMVKEIRLSEHKEKFYKRMKKLQHDIYQSTATKGLFLKNPESVRKYYKWIGLAIVFLGVFFADKIALGLVEIVSVVVSGVLVLLFGFVMPVKTKKGALIKEHIAGFRQYLSVAEKDRFAFHNGPEKNSELFEKFLPYAIALRVEKEWARQFEGILYAPPKWYNDTTRAQFGFVYFTSGLSDFVKTARTTMAAAPRSSGAGGGGFSGGGFGGGGGGSW